MSRSILAAGLAALAGFAIWTLIALLSGGESDGERVVREAWDAPAYFSIGLPVFALTAALAGYLAPLRVWRWPLWLAVGQAVGMAVAHPAGSDLGLIPLTLLFVGAPLVAALTIPAAIGATLARRGWDRGILA